MSADADRVPIVTTHAPITVGIEDGLEGIVAHVVAGAAAVKRFASGHAVRALLGGDIDAAIVVAAPDVPGLITETIATLPFVMVGRPSGHGPARLVVTSELSDEVLSYIQHELDLTDVPVRRVPSGDNGVATRLAALQPGEWTLVPAQPATRSLPQGVVSLNINIDLPVVRCVVTRPAQTLRVPCSDRPDRT